MSTLSEKKYIEHLKLIKEAGEKAQKEIEEHIERIQPKILSYSPLCCPPRKEPFEKHKEQRDDDEPVEIVVH